jgi:hypothetical protein
LAGRAESERGLSIENLLRIDSIKQIGILGTSSIGGGVEQKEIDDFI